MKNFIKFGLISVFAIFFAGIGPVQADGKGVSVTGEIVDSLCYVAMGASGEGHAKCGIACARKGIPVGIVEEGTGKLFVLLPAKDETSLPDDVINKMGKKATVTGDTYTNGGSQFLKVESVK